MDAGLFEGAFRSRSRIRHSITGRVALKPVVESRTPLRKSCVGSENELKAHWIVCPSGKVAGVTRIRDDAQTHTYTHLHTWMRTHVQRKRRRRAVLWLGHLPPLTESHHSAGRAGTMASAQSLTPAHTHTRGSQCSQALMAASLETWIFNVSMLYSQCLIWQNIYSMICSVYNVPNWKSWVNETSESSAGKKTWHLNAKSHQKWNFV